MHLSLLWMLALAQAGPPADWRPGIEGQQGAGPSVWSPDGNELAVTRWDKAGLVVLDLSTGQVRSVSEERGSGFHPVWIPDGLAFKEVVAAGGRATQRIVLSNAGARRILEEGPLLGDVGSSDSGAIVWARPGSLRVLDAGKAPREMLLEDFSNLVEPHPTRPQVALNDRDGRIRILDLSDGSAFWLTPTGGHSHPAWSSDGGSILVHTPEGGFAVYDASTGERAWMGEGRHPRWLPGTHKVVYDLPITDAYKVLEADLWLLDAESGATSPLTTGIAHERYPSPSPDGRWMAYTDTTTGDLWVAPWDGSVLGVPRRVLGGDLLPEVPPPPPPLNASPVVEMPYMHQLWDTPDDFAGYWSCGPTSCVQTVQKYQRLPDHDIQSSWPEPHISHWGWYVPSTYEFAGYTYDILGLASGDVWVPGAHGFICRDLGYAGGQWMLDFMNQHGLDAFWGGTNFSTLIDEIDAGYPMVVSSTVLDCGHIIVIKGYQDDHAIVVNDPYGDANGDWGQWDGEGAVYDWQGYNNGHLEVNISYLFGSEGPLVLPWSATLVTQDYPETLLSGQVREVSVDLRNAGTETWNPGEVFLGTYEPQDRTSDFEDSETWLQAARPATVAQATAPGGVGRFAFSLVAPDVPKQTAYEEHWSLVREGMTWFGPEDFVFEITVRPASENQAPTARADARVKAIQDKRLVLDASGSTDSDGEIVAWHWTTPDGPMEGQTVDWTPSQAGRAEVTLTVTDDLSASGTDALEISVLAASEGDKKGKGCGCSSLGGAGGIPLLVIPLVVGRRRRRSVTRT